MRKKKRSKSILINLIESDNCPRQPFLTFLSCFAVVLDAFRIVLSFIAHLVLILCISLLVLLGILYLKVKPEYTEYMNEAQAIVDESTADTFRYNEVTSLYDNAGRRIDYLLDDSATVYLKYDDIPRSAVDAFVAVENRTFWNDPGVDWKSVARVIYDAVRSKGSEVHGASTITQQLARNVFLNNGVTLDRKFKEMAIAVKLTEKYSKEDIMEFYINNIYFANGYYGLESAAYGYFGKSSSELTLGQIAYLCAIPNSPTYYDPYVDKDRPKERRSKILNDMYEMGFISKSDMDAADSEPIVLVKRQQMVGGYDVTYAVDCAVRYFMKLDGWEFQYHFDSDEEKKKYDTNYQALYEKMRKELYRGGYKIYTSYDEKKQQELQSIVDSFIEAHATEGLSDLQAAIVLMDKSRNVIACIGGTSENAAFGLNRAFQAYRQPGSSIKPLIVYTPAIEFGYSQDSIVKNINVSDALAKEKARQMYGTPYSIAEMPGTDVTMRYALEQSLNGVAYVLMDTLGVRSTVPLLEQMHFHNIVPEDYTMSAALGGLTYGVSPIEMAGAYGTIAGNGLFIEPTCITSIIDRYGKEIYNKDLASRVYSAESVEGMKDLMTGVLVSGTGASLNWYQSSEVPTYVKTGTTNEQKDAWMCGWSEPNPDEKYIMAVWTGCDIPKTGTKEGMWGSTWSGELFKESMLKVLEDTEINLDPVPNEEEVRENLQELLPEDPPEDPETESESEPDEEVIFPIPNQ